MSPVSSATSMNWPGISSGRSGGCQRTSASSPTTAPLPSSTIGW
jgi:hypothetical protein